MKQPAFLLGDDLKELDWENDALFFTHTWRDETSQFDDHPSKRWSGGLDCYTRDYSVRVPLAFEDNEELCDMFVEYMMDHYPGCKGFWVN